MSPAKPPRRQTLSWALYDWANSAFATVVIAGFFPVFFAQYWAADLAPAKSTQLLGYVSSAASLILVLSAPVLGALADQLGAKKRFLLGFTLLGVLATAALYWLGAGHWGAALALYLAGLLGFFGGNIFNDALITDVAAPEDYERASSLAYALGYLGGGILFAVNVVMVLTPDDLRARRQVRRSAHRVPELCPVVGACLRSRLRSGCPRAVGQGGEPCRRPCAGPSRSWPPPCARSDACRTPSCS